MKRKRLIRTSACLLICALLLAALCSCDSWNNFYNAFINKEETPETVVRIAVFEPLTGADATRAEAEINGIKLANSLFPTVRGTKVELVYFDNKSDPDAAKLTAAEIVRDETISLVIGSCGNMLTVASADVFEEAGMPSVNATCGNPLISNTSSYVCASEIDAFRARAAAVFAVDSLGVTQAAAMYSSSDEMSKIRAQEFSRYCEQNYKMDVPVIAVNEGSDPYFVLKTLESSEPQAVYLPAGRNLSETVIEKAKEMGLRLTWIGGDAWKGIGIEDVYFTAGYDPFSYVTEMSRTFAEAYRGRYGAAATPSEETALGFDAYLIAITALENAEDPESRESISQALMGIEDLEGCTGYITISRNGSPVKSVQVYRTEESDNELVYTAFDKQPAEEPESEAGTGGEEDQQ